MRRVFILLSILVFPFVMYAQEVTFAVKAPSTAEVGEIVDVKYEVTAKNLKTEQVDNFIAPLLVGAEIIVGPSVSTSTSVQYIEGKIHQTKSVAFTYIIKYVKEGKYVIDSAQVQVGEQTYKSEPKSITVQNESAVVQKKQTSTTPSKQSKNKPHSQFRGVEIDGTLEGVCAKLADLGYSRTSFLFNKDALSTELSGVYGGENCKLYVYTTSLTKTVYAVRVYIEKGSWHVTKDTYLKFKRLFNDKFGKPKQTVEKFTAPHMDGDGRELTALMNNKGEYRTIYANGSEDLGEINLMIGATEKGGYIIIDFVDLANIQLREQEIKDSI